MSHKRSVVRHNPTDRSFTDDQGADRRSSTNAVATPRTSAQKIGPSPSSSSPEAAAANATNGPSWDRVRPTSPEVAAELGITEKAVRLHLHLIRARLRAKALPELCRRGGPDVAAAERRATDRL